MSQFETVFNYEGVEVNIQCEKEQKIKDIYQSFRTKAKTEKSLYFMYNGNNIQNDELTIEEISNSEDKRRNKMNILVIELEGETQDSQKECIIKADNIICPICQENIKFKIEDYKISLCECKNNHDKDNIFLDEFDETQKINISKIICQKCKQYNKGNVHDNIFYKCNTCKMDICPICYSNHDKNHNIINYNDKYYICHKHNKSFGSFCEDCKKNICLLCESSHDKHNLISFGKLFPKQKKLNYFLQELKGKIDKFKDDINQIIMKLKKVSDNFETFYNINESIIKNFSQDKLNYETLYNINNINNNNSIINDINNIINDNNINNKFNKILDIYNKMNYTNKISITYKTKVDKKRLKTLKLFNKSFIDKYLNTCKMILEGKEYSLSEEFNLDKYKKNIFVIKLTGIKMITDTSYMFNNCEALSSLTDLQKWNTANITDMSYMFNNCKSLVSLPDISKWDTSKVINISYMFNNCAALTSLPDISKWDTSKVNNISYMFNNCTALASLPDISIWNTSNVKDMSGIFKGCESLNHYLIYQNGIPLMFVILMLFFRVVKNCLLCLIYQNGIPLKELI